MCAKIILSIEGASADLVPLQYRGISNGGGTKKLGDPILLDESTLTLAHSLL
jgi:hypothetical protein